MNKYKVLLRHDRGECFLTLWARSIASAVELTMKTEGCPESAIASIRRVR